MFLPTIPAIYSISSTIFGVSNPALISFNVVTDTTGVVILTCWFISWYNAVEAEPIEILPISPNKSLSVSVIVSSRFVSALDNALLSSVSKDSPDNNALISS